MTAHEHEEVATPAAGPGVAAAPSPRRTRPSSLQATMLELQRTVGNSAATMLGRRVLARKGGSSSTTGSKLVGLRNKVGWSDFQGKVPKKGVDPKHYAQMRAIATTKVGGGPANYFGPNAFDKDGGVYTLKDDVVVTVGIDRLKAWERTSSLTATRKQLLLDHEQGHYDIVALMARDMFIDLMQLKSKSWTSGQAAANECAAVLNTYNALTTKVEALYDSSSETDHEAWDSSNAKPAAQKRWEGYLQTARTRRRQPEVQAPDGAYYKVRLADVLKDAGYTL